MNAPLTLTPEQLEFVRSPAPRIVVEACPGSGKTQALTERIRADLARGVDLSRAVAITFTVNAAQELRERLGVDLGFCGTLHAYLWREYRRIEPDAILLDNAEALAQWTATAKRLRYTWTEQDAAKFKTNPTANAQTQAVAKAYIADCRAAKLVCLDSLLWSRTWAWLKASALWVDECQDSGEQDQRIYEAIDAPIKIFIGDVNQAIYGFRGGNPRWLQGLKDRGFTNLRLRRNFRSCPGIITAAERVIARHMEPARTGAAILGSLKVENEAEEIAGILQLLADGNPQTTAILCRYNFHVDNLRQALATAGIPIATPKQSSAAAPDLARLRALVGILAADSNATRERFLRTVMRPEQARAARLAAEAQNVPINIGLTIPAQLDRQSLAQFAISAKLSTESIALLCAAHKASSSPGDWEPYLTANVVTAPAQPGVWIGTIHAAKGLEWETVIISGVDMIPDRRAPLQEEKRLLYVAITRARDELYYTSAKMRRDRKTKYCPFL